MSIQEDPARRMRFKYLYSAFLFRKSWTSFYLFVVPVESILVFLLYFGVLSCLPIKATRVNSMPLYDIGRLSMVFTIYFLMNVLIVGQKYAGKFDSLDSLT